LTSPGIGIRPSVVLADDNPEMRKEISKFLQSRFNVEAVVGSGTLAVQSIAKLKPDVAILDIAMPGISGIEAARRIRELGLGTKIVFLTIQRDPDYIQAAADLDACYVLKSRLHLDLLIAIDETLAGRTFVSSPLSHRGGLAFSSQARR